MCGMEQVNCTRQETLFRNCIYILDVLSVWSRAREYSVILPIPSHLLCFCICMCEFSSKMYNVLFWFYSTLQTLVCSQYVLYLKPNLRETESYCSLLVDFPARGRTPKAYYIPTIREIRQYLYNIRPRIIRSILISVTP